VRWGWGGGVGGGGCGWWGRAWTVRGGRAGLAAGAVAGAAGSGCGAGWGWGDGRTVGWARGGGRRWSVACTAGAGLRRRSASGSGCWRGLRGRWDVGEVRPERARTGAGRKGRRAAAPGGARGVSAAGRGCGRVWCGARKRMRSHPSQRANLLHVGRRSHQRVRARKATPCAGGGIGRRAGFRFQCPQGRGGSTPPSRTSQKDPC
jgi:hypothetical protein